MKTSRIAAVVAFTTVAISGCSSSEPAEKSVATPAVTQAFEPPAGITLTPGGTSLKVGEPATVVYPVGDRTASAVTVAVTAVTAGSIDDFRSFSLDAASAKASPFYVTASVTNEGPAGLGGAALPMVAVDSTNGAVPANDIIGTFEPCQGSTLPVTFLPAATASVCLVYLVPEGRTLASIRLQTGSADDAVAWKR